MRKNIRINGSNEIGKTVEKSLEEYFRKLDGEPPHGIYDMVITNVYGGPEPYYLYNDFLNSANTLPVGQRALHNFPRFRDPAVDAATDPADKATFTTMLGSVVFH